MIFFLRFNSFSKYILKNHWVYTAMENWGLVTFTKVDFIFNPAVDTYVRQLNLTDMVAHELSHQWFGNIVTTKWWSQLWLNEGFATLFAFIATDLVRNMIFLLISKSICCIGSDTNDEGGGGGGNTWHGEIHTRKISKN